VSPDVDQTQQGRATTGVSTQLRLPRVKVISLGGTIASLDTDPAGLLGALPRLGAFELVAALPGIGEVAEVTACSRCGVASANLSVQDLLRLSASISASYAAGFDGVVVTQGTDTLEETSFVLDLLHGRPEPLVLTGAMRTADAPGADGPANLAAAIQVASAGLARGLGAVVVMADEIHAARWVAKRHTSGVAAFESPMTGPIGWVSEGKTRVAAIPVPMPRMSAPDPKTLAPVATVALGLGDDGRLLSALPELGYGGLVVEGLGGGHVPAATISTVSDLASKIPVVIASRTGSGELLCSTYGFSGSEVDLLSRGVVSAGALSAPKARLLLMLLLAAGVTRGDLAADFARFSVPRGVSAE
jgi:L-asparaginase